MRQYNTLIVGFGNIGSHLYEELKSNTVNIYIYDKFKDGYIHDIDEFRNMRFDNAFVCVPTEMEENGRCDTSQVRDAVRSLARINVETIVIKSTVPVGFCDEMSRSLDYIVFSPEYYGTTIHAPKKLDFVVLAGNKKHCEKVAEFYYAIKSSSLRVRYTDFRTAELAKYMENCFLAMKVAFCSEFSIIAEQFGISYPELREIFILDERMGDSHTLIRSDQPYYDSHCLNKDIPGLITQTSEAKLMKAVDQINKERKRNKK